MVFIDAGTDSILIATIPVLTVLAYMIFIRKENKKGLFFVVGFLSITEFYIISSDPAILNSLYISQGNYIFPFEVTAIATLFLLISLIYFRKHIDE